MIPPDDEMTLEMWIDPMLRTAAILLEIAIFITLVRLRSVTGVAFCMLYIWFSATWDVARQGLDMISKEKK